MKDEDVKVDECVCHLWRAMPDLHCPAHGMTVAQAMATTPAPDSERALLLAVAEAAKAEHAEHYDSGGRYAGCAVCCALRALHAHPTLVRPSQSDGEGGK